MAATEEHHERFAQLRALNLKTGRAWAIKTAACGFRRFEDFKTAIFFHCGGLQLYPLTHAIPG